MKNILRVIIGGCAVVSFCTEVSAANRFAGATGDLLRETIRRSSKRAIAAPRVPLKLELSADIGGIRRFSAAAWRGYSSTRDAVDLIAPWNKGHVPTVTYDGVANTEQLAPFDSTALMPSAKLTEKQTRRSKRVWHFDPVRALYYYRSYYPIEDGGSREQEGLTTKLPIKEDADMVVFSLQKKKR